MEKSPTHPHTRSHARRRVRKTSTGKDDGRRSAENKSSDPVASPKGVVSPERPGSKSPDQPCSICLGQLQDKSFTDSCLHMFCFVCLQEWSKVKAECPLCKQKFSSIIHNVRSNDDYDTYKIPIRHPRVDDFANMDGRRFRYQTTLTFERRFLIHGLHDHFMHRPNHEHDYTLQRPTHLSAATRSLWRRYRQTATSDFRRRVYVNNLRVSNVEDPRLRIRDITPLFFRTNEACIHRLVPWLNRELNALLQGRIDQVQFVLDLIIGLIKNYSIRSEEFYQHLYPYIGRHTRHFMHELECFAKSPYHMAAYDQHAVYQPQTTTIEDDSDTDSIVSVDDDDDVIIINSPTSEAVNSISNPRNSRNNSSVPEQPPPPERRERDVAFESITPLLNRVRTYLEYADPINAAGWSIFCHYQSSRLDI